MTGLRRVGWRSTIVLALAAAWFALTAGYAVAATTASVGGGTLTVTAGPEPNGIKVQFNAFRNRYIVTDGAGVAGGGCPVEFSVLVCDAGDPLAPVRTIAISSGDGDDYVEALAGSDPVVPTGATVTVDGGAGNDELGAGQAVQATITAGPGDDILRAPSAFSSLLSGGAGNDRLEGSPGADRLEGRGGEDDLKGFGGIDELLGGGGSDRLRATDRVKDELLSCGTGRDRVGADRFDPRPRGCERRR